MLFTSFLILFLINNLAKCESTITITECNSKNYSIYRIDHDVDLYYYYNNESTPDSSMEVFSYKCDSANCETKDLFGYNIKAPPGKSSVDLYKAKGRGKRIQDSILILKEENVYFDFSTGEGYDNNSEARLFWRANECEKHHLFYGVVNESKITHNTFNITYISFAHKEVPYTLTLTKYNRKCNYWKTDQDNIIVSTSSASRKYDSSIFDLSALEKSDKLLECTMMDDDSSDQSSEHDDSIFDRNVLGKRDVLGGSRSEEKYSQLPYNWTQPPFWAKPELVMSVLTLIMILILMIIVLTMRKNVAKKENNSNYASVDNMKNRVNEKRSVALYETVDYAVNNGVTRNNIQLNYKISNKEGDCENEMYAKH